MKYKIGVVGSAADSITSDILAKAREMGREIAKNDCILVSGGGPGVPYEAIKSAKENNGFTIGFSPASDLPEHVARYKFPTEHFDVLIYTGFGLKGRNVLFVRSCDGIIAISGRVGTLNELTIAFDEGKIIGILKGVGGVCEIFEKAVKITGKKGGKIIYNYNPKSLVKHVIDNLRSIRKRSK